MNINTIFKNKFIFFSVPVIIVIAVFFSASFYFYKSADDKVVISLDNMSGYIDGAKTTTILGEGGIQLPLSKEVGGEPAHLYYSKPHSLHHDFVVENNIMYVVYSDNQFEHDNIFVDIVDISNPAELKLLSTYSPDTGKTANYHKRIAVKDSFLYFIYTLPGEKFFIQSVDVRNPAEPRNIQTHQFGGLGGEFQMKIVKDVEIDGDYLYIENIIERKEEFREKEFGEKEISYPERREKLKYQITKLHIADPENSQPAGSEFLNIEPNNILDVVFKGDYRYVLVNDGFSSNLLVYKNGFLENNIKQHSGLGMSISDDKKSLYTMGNIGKTLYLDIFDLSYAGLPVRISWHN